LSYFCCEFAEKNALQVDLTKNEKNLIVFQDFVRDNALFVCFFKLVVGITI